MLYAYLLDFQLMKFNVIINAVISARTFWEAGRFGLSFGLRQVN